MNDERLNGFPQGSIEFDHGLVMRKLPQKWHQADDFYARSQINFGENLGV